MVPNGTTAPPAGRDADDTSEIASSLSKTTSCRPVFADPRRALIADLAGGFPQLELALAAKT